MGLFLDKPKREKVMDSGEGNNLRFAVSAMQGWRVDMEDSHSMKASLAPNLSTCSYFAVFDGHAGDFVSKYAAEHLHETILENLEGCPSHKLTEAEGSSESNRMIHDEAASQSVGGNQNSDSTLVTSNACSNIAKTNENEENKGKDESVNSGNGSTSKKDDLGLTSDQVQTMCEEKVKNSIDIKHSINDLEHFKACVRKGFLDIDEKLKELPQFVAGDERSGSTAIAVFVTDTHVMFANCGDSRALLSGSGGEIRFATVDHKPYNTEERERIEKAGGSVIIQRVNGSLAVSRALGDFDYKRVPGIPCTEQLVSAEPELTCIERHAEDEFLFLACDGIWDVLSNQEITDFIRYRLSIHQDLVKLCGEILETSLEKGSKDNMSVVLVTFPGAPKVSEKAQESEKRLDQLLKEKISGFIKGYSDPKDIDMSVVIDFLQDQDVPDLPPGGGLHSKMSVIESILDELVPDRTKEEGPQHGASIPVPLNMIRQLASGGMIDDDEDLTEKKIDQD